LRSQTSQTHRLLRPSLESTIQTGEEEMNPYDPNRNSKNSFNLAIDALREIGIRSRVLLPEGADIERERRWAVSGPVPNDQLETVRMR
jgi:hypothetical protein